MSPPASTTLTSRQRLVYDERGYHWPLRAFSEESAAGMRRHFERYWEETSPQREGRLPRDWRNFLMETHLFQRWVYDIASNPRVLDAVESVLGPDILIWSSHWFPKSPRDGAYVSWHQDATYWGLSPPNVTTAWIALSETTPENGCLRVVPGTHRGELLPQRETYAEANMLSRGQEIAVEVDEAAAVDLTLRPGEFSLHHVGIVHGSGPNRSDGPRIGVAVRYLSPDVVQREGVRDFAMLVRGQDVHGRFDLVEPPDRDVVFGESALHTEAMARKTRNLSK